MAKINKVGHVVFGCRDPQASIKFYTEALGMELVQFNQELQMAFTADHFLTKSVYVFDPDGNRLESFCASMEMAAAPDPARQCGPLIPVREEGPVNPEHLIAPPRTWEELRDEVQARTDRQVYPMTGMRSEDVRSILSQIGSLDRDA